MDTAHENTLGIRIRTLRLTNGLTVDTAARSAGVSRTAWINWERGARVPALSRGAAIARALGEPVGALFASEPVFEVALTRETVESVRRDGREAARVVAERIASQLEPAIYAAATRKPVDISGGARPKPRRTRAQVLAGVREADRLRRARIAREREQSAVLAAA